MTSWKEMEKVKIPPGIKAALTDFELTIGGSKGELKKRFSDNYVSVSLKDGEASISVSKENHYSKSIVGTWKSLIQSMINGVQSGYQYEMKIDYTHFPMRVSVRGDKVVIENFLGERSARTAKVVGHCSVSVKGDRVFVSGIDRYEVGETAANIERATKIKGFDLRVFQDGIYLIGGN